MKRGWLGMALAMARLYLGPAPGPVFLEPAEEDGNPVVLMRLPCPLAACGDDLGSYWRWNPKDPLALYAGWPR